jgi:L-fucose mutarotase
MLKGLSPLLTPDVLYALCAMGHGDEVAIVDAHYPTDVAARSSVYGKLLRMDGVALPVAVRTALSALILDTFADHPVERIDVVRVQAVLHQPY